jgi:GNAT superfamily N-acetyltransferase
MKYLKLFEDRGLQSMLNNIKRKYVKVGCKIDLVPRYYDSIYLSMIEVPDDLKGKGIAKAFMKDLTDFADEQGLIITLSPTDRFGSDLERLKNLYFNFGFQINRNNGIMAKYTGQLIRFPENK